MTINKASVLEVDIFLISNSNLSSIIVKQNKHLVRELCLVSWLPLGITEVRTPNSFVTMCLGIGL